MQGQRPTVAFFERLLVQLDVFPFGAAFRVVIGYMLVSTFRHIVGVGTDDWRILPWFVVVLCGVRFLPAVVRAIVPFPQGAKAVWAERRVLAKRFDSYQWRKLFWFGVGMATYVVIARDTDVPLVALASVAIAAGCLGEYVWRITGARA